MAAGIKKFLTNDQLAQRVVQYLLPAANGDITADQTFHYIAPFDGRFDSIADLFLQAANTGSDGTDALAMELDVQINGTTVFTTKPKLNGVLTAGVAGAADGADTRATGTGITVGVLETDLADRSTPTGRAATGQRQTKGQRVVAPIH